jgi:hypothetical protein
MVTNLSPHHPTLLPHYQNAIPALTPKLAGKIIEYKNTCEKNFTLRTSHQF